jgi:hypothetical protein
MSESRVRENRMHGSMRRREATPDQLAMPRGPRTPPADPTTGSLVATIARLASQRLLPDTWSHARGVAAKTRANSKAG